MKEAHIIIDETEGDTIYIWQGSPLWPTKMTTEDLEVIDLDALPWRVKKVGDQLEFLYDISFYARADGLLWLNWLRLFISCQVSEWWYEEYWRFYWRLTRLGKRIRGHK